MLYFLSYVNTRKELIIFFYNYKVLDFKLYAKNNYQLEIDKKFYNLEICFEILETFLDTVVLFREPFLEAFITCD